MKIGNVTIIGVANGTIEFTKNTLGYNPVCQEEDCGKKLISCTLTEIGTCCPYCSSSHTHKWTEDK